MTGLTRSMKDQDGQGPVYLQVSRGDVVLHLSGHHTDSSPGAVARAEVRGLPSYHHQLINKGHLPMLLTLGPTYWNNRVLEMEVTDPFGNRLIFCEPGVLSGSS